MKNVQLEKTDSLVRVRAMDLMIENRQSYTIDYLTAAQHVFVYMWGGGNTGILLLSDSSSYTQPRSRISLIKYCEISTKI